jgi:protein-S-isoprenylcysteine O-methyltransferase Ste14
MQSARRIKTEGRTIALQDRAMDNLRFIRETMERSTSFTAVSGAAGVVMGAVALVASFVAARQITPEAWIATWLTAALLSGAVALWAMILKARRIGMPLLSGPPARGA